MSVYSFHPEALLEYAEATSYYAKAASLRVATAFVATIEDGIRAVLKEPDRWRVVEQPDIRRYVFRRLPYVLYYRCDPASGHVTIYALMHSSREPGFWKGRCI